MTQAPPAGGTERVTSMDQVLKRFEAGFWRRYNADPDLQKKLAGKDRMIQLDLVDGPGYLVHIVDGRLTEMREGRDEKAPVVITAKAEDLYAILNKEIGALQAYLTKRVRVKASFGDILFAKSLLGW